MTAPTRDRLNAMLPWLCALGGMIANVAWVSHEAGVVTQEVRNVVQRLDDHIHDSSVHMPLARQYELFTPRAEAMTLKASRDAEQASMRAEYRDGFAVMRIEMRDGFSAVNQKFEQTNAKIDRLIEHQLATVK